MPVIDTQINPRSEAFKASEQAMLALVLMEHALRQRAQNGDVSSPLQAIEASFL